MKRVFAIYIFLFFSSFCLAQTQLAFFTVYSPEGEVLQLEENGQYYHVAISYEEKWFHVHKERGAEIITNFSEAGFESYDVTVLQKPNLNLPKEEVTRFLGLPFDKAFNWDDRTTAYCSEIIAKLLRIEPTPMKFAPRIWGRKHPDRGKLGISPDEVYEKALQMNFRILTRIRGPAQMKKIKPTSKKHSK